MSARSCVFGAGDGGLGDDDRFFALGHFRLGLHDVDGRHGADLDAGAVLLERALRQIERQPLHVEAVEREDQVPVGVLHRAGGAWRRPRAPARRRSRGSCATPAAAAGAVDAEVAQQRLREVEGEVGAGLGREVRKDVVGGRARVVPAHAVAGAAPRQGRRQPEVHGGRVVLQFVDVTGQEAVDRGVAVGALAKVVKRGRPGRRAPATRRDPAAAGSGAPLRGRRSAAAPVRTASVMLRRRSGSGGAGVWA